MTITTTQQGKFRVNVRRIVNGQPYRWQKTFDTRKEALSYERRIKVTADASTASGLAVVSPKLMLIDAWATFKENEFQQAKAHGPARIAVRTRFLKRAEPVFSYFEKVKVTELATPMVLNFI